MCGPMAYFMSRPFEVNVCFPQLFDEGGCWATQPTFKTLRDAARLRMLPRHTQTQSVRQLWNELCAVSPIGLTSFWGGEEGKVH